MSGLRGEKGEKDMQVLCAESMYPDNLADRSLESEIRYLKILKRRSGDEQEVRKPPVKFHLSGSPMMDCRRINLSRKVFLEFLWLKNAHTKKTRYIVVTRQMRERVSLGVEHREDLQGGGGGGREGEREGGRERGKERRREKERERDWEREKREREREREGERVRGREER